MKIWPVLSFFPALLIGIYLGTYSWGSKQTVKSFVDMRLPADVDSDFTLNLSREVDLEDIGSGNFIFNSKLEQNKNSWGISSKSFYLQSGDQFIDVCDFLNSNDGFVSYRLVAENVANSGENIEIDVSQNCNGFDYVELFPFEFCSADFDGFSNEVYETESSNYNFINFSDFMPKSWYLKEVNFSYVDRYSGALGKDTVFYNSEDPIIVSCFDN